MTFLSKLYSGAISDQAIVQQSKFCENLEEGDDAMANRGFNLRHLVLKKKSNINHSILLIWEWVEFKSCEEIKKYCQCTD